MYQIYASLKRTENTTEKFNARLQVSSHSKFLHNREKF